MSSRFILTAPYNGISQDSFYGDTGECAYMQDINTDEMRFEKLEHGFTVAHTLGNTDDVNQMVETPYGIISCLATKVFVGAGDKSAVVAGAKRVEFLGDATGNQKNYFFNNASVIETDGNVTTVVNTAAHAGGTVTASVVIYNTILFAIGSTVYKYDTVTHGITTLTTITIPAGSTIKYMYFYNDMLVIITKKQNDTINYQVQFDGTNYTIYSTEIKQGYSVVNAIGDGNIVYWLTNTKILGFSGGASQEIRFIGYGSSLGEVTFSSPLLSIKEGNINIATGTTLYKFGSRHAGRRKALTIKTFSSTILGLSQNYIHVQNVVSSVTSNRIYGEASTYPDSGYSISLPYDTGIYGDKKSNLAFRVGYILKTGTSITLGVMTDEMELSNSANYVTVATITDTTTRRQHISVGEINSALETAGFNSDWQYIRFKRTLTGGGGSSGARTQTPKLFEIKAIHNTISDELED